jgi:GNAT superfamily N-acetyltransferase
VEQRHPLDNPTRASLLGPHAGFAESLGQVVRYPAEVAPFLALPDEPDESAWDDVAALVGPGALVVVAGIQTPPPEGWAVAMNIAGVQLVDDGVAAAADSEAVRLRLDDVPQMLDLAERTRPGPFLARTIELGTYRGIRRRGTLVAMAGERLRPPGWTEISAVCTDVRFRGQGLATRLVLAVAADVRARGETPFLHAAASNTNAIRLYESLGFRLRRSITFLALRVPSAERVG